MMKKLISYVLVFTLLFCGSMAMLKETFAAEKEINISGVRLDEYGMNLLQKVKGSDVTAYQWNSFNDYHELYVYKYMNGKMKKTKTNIGKKAAKQQKIIQLVGKSGLDDGCLDHAGKNIYIPCPQFGKKVVLYKLSLSKDSVKKIVFKKKDIGNIAKEASSANHVKCFPISKNKIGFRVALYGKKSHEVKGYRVCIMNTETNKIIKYKTCNFDVEGMNEKYIYGMTIGNEANLCYTKWGKSEKESSVPISNPQYKQDNNENASDGEALYPMERKNCNRVSMKGNTLYYITLSGLYKYNISSKKTTCVMETGKSKYLSKYIPNYVKSMLVAGNQVFLLCAETWETGSVLIRVQ